MAGFSTLFLHLEPLAEITEPWFTLQRKKADIPWKTKPNIYKKTPEVVRLLGTEVLMMG